MIEVLTALPGIAWEGDVVARLERGTGGVRVVRRCVDLPDLLAVAAAGVGDAVLLSADLRRLDRDALVRLAAARVAVVGLHAPEDAASAERLRMLGVARLLAADSAGANIAEAVVGAVSELAEHPDRGALSYSEPLRSLGVVPHTRDVDEPVVPLDRPGSLVAVWGPTGAPGRTTVAVTLASEAAALGVTSLLVDADCYGGVIAPCLGLLDEFPGLAAAARHAQTGTLDRAALAALTPQVEPGLRVLTGIPRADRWPELRPVALELVYAQARELARLVVVDCGFCLEQDEEISFDVAAPRRNGSTLVTLEQADTVVAVCSGDALGIPRFVRALAELHELVPGADVRVVVNRVRRGAVGAHPERQVLDALERYAGVTTALVLPEDRTSLDAALLQGLTLREGAPRSVLRAPLAALAADLAGLAPVGRRRGRSRRAG